MPNLTPELGLAIAVDADDTATYLETNLGGSLTTVDSLFNATSGHTHSGAHQGGPITSAGVADGSLTNAKLGPDVARANLLTNGGFEIWQRGAGPFTSAGTGYSADRWSIFASATVTQESTVIDTSSKYSAKCVVTASGTYVGQKMEDFVQLGSRTVSLSMRVWCNTANAARLDLQVGGGTDNYSAYHPGDSAWHTLTVTVTLPAAITALYCYVSFNAACTAYLDNAMLVVGSQPANYVPMHPADDLARCLRYYEILGEGGGGSDVYLSGYATAGAQNWQTSFAWRALKAVTPTLTKNGTWGTSNCGQPTIYGNQVGGFSAYITSTAAGLTQSGNSAAGCNFTAEANP